MKRVTSPKKKATRKVARKAASPRPPRRRAVAVADYDLVLFICGASDRSWLALAKIKAIASKHLEGRYRLSVGGDEVFDGELELPPGADIVEGIMIPPQAIHGVALDAGESVEERAAEPL